MMMQDVGTSLLIKTAVLIFLEHAAVENKDDDTSPWAQLLSIYPLPTPTLY